MGLALIKKSRLEPPAMEAGEAHAAAVDFRSKAGLFLVCLLAVRTALRARRVVIAVARRSQSDAFLFEDFREVLHAPVPNL